MLREDLIGWTNSNGYATLSVAIPVSIDLPKDVSIGLPVSNFIQCCQYWRFCCIPFIRSSRNKDGLRRRTNRGHLLHWLINFWISRKSEWTSTCTLNQFDTGFSNLQKEQGQFDQLRPASIILIRKNRETAIILILRRFRRITERLLASLFDTGTFPVQFGILTDF